MANRGATVGLVGAASLLGREILGLLEEERGSVSAVRALSEKVVGATIEWRGDDLDVVKLSEEQLEGLPLVIFCPGEKRSARWAPAVAKRGASVVDLSAARRLDPETELVGLGEAPAVGPRSRSVSVPGAGSLMAARLLAPLERPAGLRGVTATFLVPASGGGAAGLKELGKQSAALLGSANVRAKRFPHRLAFNIIPEIAGLDGGEDRSEVMFRNELRRLLGAPELAVAATALRVPVFFGMCAVFSIELSRPFDVGAARELWRHASGIKLLDDPGAHVYPMASLAAGDEAVQVGRIRGGGQRLQLFAAVDQLRLVAKVAVETALDLLRLSPQSP